MTMISRCFTMPIAAFLRAILLALWAFAWVIVTANSTSAAPDLSSLCDQAAMNALLSAIAATGWHDYFDTINAAGVGGDLNQHLGQLAAA